VNGIPSPCPCCGAYSLAPDTQTTILVAVCDVLVVKALERVGSFILRGPDRKRYQEAGALPRHAIHTVWRAPDELTARALQGAWDVVPALLDSHGCCDVASDDVIRVLDSYVHDLVITGTEHHVIGDDGLEHRFVCHLGLSLPRYERATA
jgi:hypothetical protein